jgi:hypothetical protein
MEKELLIKKISESLKEIYQKNSSEGMLAIYIWGSILTPDFNSQTSDIDTIAIVDNNISIEYETKIQKELAAMHPEIRKLGFRLIYKNELDTGVAKSPLGIIGIPALLLLDLPTWQWVCGTKFSQKDFSLHIPTYDEALKLRYESTKTRWPIIDLIKPEEVQYFVKQVLRIIHLNYLQNGNFPYRMFSYSSIKENVTDSYEAEIIDICLKVKASHWNYEEFKKYKNKFESYLSNHGFNPSRSAF